MKIVIISVGKEKDEITDDIIHHFQNRVLRYLPLEWIFIPHESLKDLPAQTGKESDKILSHIKKEDFVVLLDEKGKEIKSEALAELIENRMIDSVRKMIFIIGGAYGVTNKIHERANYIWKLSSLVFPHMLVRVILMEQLYRAMTIIKGEKYHHN